MRYFHGKNVMNCDVIKLILFVWVLPHYGRCYPFLAPHGYHPPSPVFLLVFQIKLKVYSEKTRNNREITQTEKRDWRLGLSRLWQGLKELTLHLEICNCIKNILFLLCVVLIVACILYMHKLNWISNSTIFALLEVYECVFLSSPSRK